jgi:HTH-type transcriptional regulator/antitoxin HigA
MHIKPIQTDADHARAVELIDAIWGAQAPKPGTAKAEALERLVTLVVAYEEQHHAIEAPDPR